MSGVHTIAKFPGDVVTLGGAVAEEQLGVGAVPP